MKPLYIFPRIQSAIMISATAKSRWINQSVILNTVNPKSQRTIQTMPIMRNIQGGSEDKVLYFALSADDNI